LQLDLAREDAMQRQVVDHFHILAAKNAVAARTNAMPM
jgi:hypothetical protein